MVRQEPPGRRSWRVAYKSTGRCAQAVTRAGSGKKGGARGMDGRAMGRENVSGGSSTGRIRRTSTQGPMVGSGAICPWAWKWQIEQS